MDIDKKEMAQVWAERSNPENMNKLVGYFMEMASQIAGKMKLSSYYREDYAQAAATHAFNCVDKYKPEKKSNPFSYFYKMIMLAVLYEMRKDKNKRDKSPSVCSWDKLMNTTKDEDFSSKYEDSSLYENDDEDRIIQIGGNIFTHKEIKVKMNEAKKSIKTQKLVLLQDEIYSEKHNVFVDIDDSLKKLMIYKIIEKKKNKHI